LGARARRLPSLVVFAAASFGVIPTSPAVAGTTVHDDEGDLVPCEEKTSGKVVGPSGFDLSELVLQDGGNGEVTLIVRARGNLSDTVRDEHGLLDVRIDLAADGRYFRLLRGFTPDGHAISEVRDPQGALVPDALLVAKEAGTGGAMLRVPPLLAHQLGPGSRVGVAISYEDPASGQLVCDLVGLDGSGRPTVAFGELAATTAPGPGSTTSPAPAEPSPRERPADAPADGGAGFGWWWLTIPGVVALIALFWWWRHIVSKGQDGAPPTPPPEQTDVPPDIPAEASSKPREEAVAGPLTSGPQREASAENASEAEPGSRPRSRFDPVRAFAQIFSEAVREAGLRSRPDPKVPLTAEEQREIEKTIFEDLWTRIRPCEMSDRAIQRLIESLEGQLENLYDQLEERIPREEAVENSYAEAASRWLSEHPDATMSERLDPPVPEKQQRDEMWAETGWYRDRIARVRKQIQFLRQKLAQRDYGA